MSCQPLGPAELNEYGSSIGNTCPSCFSSWPDSLNPAPPFTASSPCHHIGPICPSPLWSNPYHNDPFPLRTMPLPSFLDLWGFRHMAEEIQICGRPMVQPVLSFLASSQATLTCSTDVTGFFSSQRPLTLITVRLRPKSPFLRDSLTVFSALPVCPSWHLSQL